VVFIVDKKDSRIKAKMTKIRTRFAPSPTGSLHIGGLRTALYSYALAKHDKGDFILRIEDTDKKREVAGGVEQIKKMLETFALKWDEFYIQSQRLDNYQKAAEKLVKIGHAFYCQCQAKNAKEQGYSKVLRDPCRDKNLNSGAIKLKIPENEVIGYRDFVLEKEISWKSKEIADTTLLKSDGFPTYHLAVVVDDEQMKITHVLRGHDWMPSTPIHLLVYKYLGLSLPQIGHLTDILDPQGGKLSKRKGSVACEKFLQEGYLPEAILNFIMLLGWAPKDNKEIFSLEEFVKAFSPMGLQKSNPVFNREKLDWFNGEYIRQLSIGELNSRFVLQDTRFSEFDKQKQLAVTKLVQERIKKLSDFNELAGFFLAEPDVDQSLFGKNYREHLNSAFEVLSGTKWNLEAINQAFLQQVKKKSYKTGDFFMDLRIAICGSKFTPPINESIEILGREETLKRIKKQIS
jgi:glutamyl-tRNA synthetase